MNTGLPAGIWISGGRGSTGDEAESVLRGVALHDVINGVFGYALRDVGTSQEREFAMVRGGR